MCECDDLTRPVMLVPRACVCVPDTWHTGTVSVASSGLATVGGTTVDITGVHLGLSPAVISVTLTGGSLGLAVRAYSLPPGACVVVDPGVAIRCSTVAGVGANYTVTVDVDGGHSDPSVDKVSYARPMISSVEGPGAVGAATRGGAQVSLHGVRGGAWSSGRALLWSVCVLSLMFLMSLTTALSALPCVRLRVMSFVLYVWHSAVLASVQLRSCGREHHGGGVGVPCH